MKALAIMQNQWLKRPDVHAATLASVEARHGAEERARFRRRFIHRALFAGCLSGRVLKKHLGAVTDEIVWEEASKVITPTPYECPPADPDHIRYAIEDTDADIIIGFGKIANAALNTMLGGISAMRKYDRSGKCIIFIQSPHPAARGASMQESVREACVSLLNHLGRY